VEEKGITGLEKKKKHGGGGNRDSEGREDVLWPVRIALGEEAFCFNVSPEEERSSSKRGGRNRRADGALRLVGQERGGREFVISRSRGESLLPGHLAAEGKTPKIEGRRGLPRKEGFIGISTKEEEEKNYY